MRFHNKRNVNINTEGSSVDIFTHILKFFWSRIQKKNLYINNRFLSIYLSNLYKLLIFLVLLSDYIKLLIFSKTHTQKAIKNFQKKNSYKIPIENRSKNHQLQTTLFFQRQIQNRYNVDIRAVSAPEQQQQPRPAIIFHKSGRRESAPAWVMAAETIVSGPSPVC